MVRHYKLGILGCGAIAEILLENIILKGKLENILIAGVYDKNPNAAEEFKKKFGVRIFEEVDDMIKECDIILECASQEAVFQYGEKILSNGRSLIVMSSGAFSNTSFLKKMRGIAREKNVKIYLPSGAILGLDGIKAGKFSELERVELIVRKNPRSFKIRDEKEKVLYDGDAKRGVSLYPMNVNIASTISLAGIGFEKTRLKIISDPKVDRNIHEILAKGSFGEFRIKIKNVTSKRNPRTSILAAYSVLALLERLTSELEIGC